jgi:tape measure domain-containing protein
MGARAVGKAGVAFGKAGIMDNAEVETYLSSLKILLKDQDKANKLFKDLQKMDLELPVDIGMLAQNAQKLAGAGFDPQKIEGLMRVLLDTASISPMGTNEGTSRIVRAFTQIRGKGNIQLEDLNQISELGVPIRQIIQEQFGMSAQDLGDRTRDGTLTVDQAIEGMVEGLEKRFGGSLEARANTMSGMLEQVHDRFKALRREMTEPFFEQFRDALGGITKWMQGADFEQLTAQSENLSRAFMDLLKQINGYSGSGGSGGGGGSGLLTKATASAAFLMDSAAAAGTYGADAGVPQSESKIQNMYNGFVAATIDSVVGGMTGRKSAALQAFEARQTESALAATGQFGAAYKMAERRGDKNAMSRYRKTSPELDAKLSEQEAEAARKAEREKAQRAADKNWAFAQNVAGFMTRDGSEAFGKVFDAVQAMQQGFGGGANPTPMTKGLYNAVGGSAIGIGNLIGDTISAGKRFAVDFSKGSIEARNNQAIAADGSRRTDAQKRLADLIAQNPELAGAELTSQLTRGKDGKFRTKFGVGKMGDAGGVTQTTDFANLNRMIQGQVDQASVEQNTKKSAELLQKLVDDLNGEQEHRTKLEQAMQQKTISVVAP